MQTQTALEKSCSGKTCTGVGPGICLLNSVSLLNVTHFTVFTHRFWPKLRAFRCLNLMEDFSLYGTRNEHAR